METNDSRQAIKFLKKRDVFIRKCITNAITIMDDEIARQIWDLIRYEYYPVTKSWEDIKEKQPVGLDLEMLEAIENDPDCKKFVSKKEAMRELNF